MKYTLLALVGAVGLAACSGEKPGATFDKDTLMHNDFESLIGWIPDPAALTQEQAHSGRYSLKVDPTHEYSLGYNYLLGQLTPTRIRGVRVDAWAFSPSEHPGGQLVVAVNNTVGGSAIVSQRIDFSADVKESDKWVKVSKEIIFPPNANYTSQLVIYLWRSGQDSKAFIDDIQLTALR